MAQYNSSTLYNSSTVYDDAASSPNPIIYDEPGLLYDTTNIYNYQNSNVYVHTVTAVLTVAPTTANRPHNIRAVLQATPLKTHEIDVLLISNNKTHTIDALLTNQLIQLVDVDAVLSKTLTKTHTIDAFVASPLARAHTITTILQKTFTKTHQLRAVIALTKTRAHSVDAFVSPKQVLLPTFVDAFLGSPPLSNPSGGSLIYCPQKFVTAMAGFNPLGHWQLNDTGTAVNLGSGGGALAGSYTNVITMQGDGPLAAEQDILCAYFDGANSYINLGTDASLNLTSTYSLVAMVKRDNNSVDHVIVCSAGSSTINIPYIFGIQATTNKLFLTHASGAASETIVSTGTVPVGEWHMVSVTKSGTSISFFIDGVAAGTATATITPAAGGVQQHSIGRGHSSDPDYFKGNIGQVAIFTTQEAVATHLALWRNQANMHVYVINSESDITTNTGAVFAANATLTSSGVIERFAGATVTVTSSAIITQSTLSARALVTLDGIVLTDQGRTFNSDADLRVIEVENAKGEISQYIQAIKHKFNIEWEWLPSSSSQTYDGNAARDAIYNLIMSKKTHILELVSNASDERFKYIVFVSNYSEELMRRDINAEASFYRVSLELIEK